MDGEATRSLSGRPLVRVLVVCGLVLAGVRPAAAQIANPDAAALGMGGNYAAVARGYAALAWNPALLALVDGPTYSVAVLAPSVGFGLDPVSAPLLVRNVDRAVPLSTRQAWLNAILAKGGESGVADGGLTYLALSTGSFGLQVSTMASGVVDATPELARLALTGRVPGGTQADQLAGGRLDAAVTSSVSAAYARHFPVHLARYPMAELTMGLTLRYTVGHFLATGLPEPQTQGPGAGQPGFMVMQTDPGLAGGSNGHGVGIDVGAALRLSRLTVSLGVHNLFDSFSWTTANLAFRPVSALFEAPDSTVPGPFSDAPADLQKRALDLTFRRALVLGASYRVTPRLLLTADARDQGSGGLDFSARSRLGVGARYLLLPSLPVRLGIAARSDGYELGAGVGFNLDGFGLALSGGLRHTNLGTGSLGALTISYEGLR